MNAQPQGIGTTTDRVSVQWDFDGGPTRHRIGLIALDSDVVTEQDFHRMLPEGVMFYTTRVQTHHPLTVENLRKMGPKLAAATRLLTPERRLDVIAYSCTSGTVAIGDEAVTEQIRAGSRLDVPVITPITSALAGFGAIAGRPDFPPNALHRLGQPGDAPLSRGPRYHGAQYWQLLP